MEPVYDLIARLLTDHFGVPEDEITPDSTFEQLEVDSLAKAEMVTLMEDHLHLTIGQELQGATLREVVATVERLLTAGIGPQQRADGSTALAGPAR
ncbi:phosphopantetheine-binding protein [Streptomyces sp. NPDC026206]|uniref:acyl carrier protein n=1 Tax=Streptomyces sp. NPDC026206 TaxID=3157089 RepID=UPI0033DF06B9